MFIGQTRLFNVLNQYDINTFPKSTALIGDIGCGKHTLAKIISEKLNIDIIDITENINLEFIEDVYLRNTLTLYTIDIDELTDKQQNVILKFLEEPPTNAFVMLLCENTLNLLNTIINRCVVFEFDKYTREELLSFTSNEKLLEVCTTPGQIINCVNIDIDALTKLCDTIISKMNVALYPNALTISDKFNYRDEYDKFDINIFFNCLLRKLRDTYVNTRNPKVYNYYMLSLEYKKRFKRDKRLNKQILIENFITNLWKLSRETN